MRTNMIHVSDTKKNHYRTKKKIWTHDIRKTTTEQTGWNCAKTHLKVYTKRGRHKNENASLQQHTSIRLLLGESAQEKIEEKIEILSHRAADNKIIEMYMYMYTRCVMCMMSKREKILRNAHTHTDYFTCHIAFVVFDIFAVHSLSHSCFNIWSDIP